jgi:hypothetical protein
MEAVHLARALVGATIVPGLLWGLAVFVAMAMAMMMVMVMVVAGSVLDGDRFSFAVVGSTAVAALAPTFVCLAAPVRRPADRASVHGALAFRLSLLAPGSRACCPGCIYPKRVLTYSKWVGNLPWCAGAGKPAWPMRSSRRPGSA